MPVIETKKALNAAKPFRYLDPRELDMLIAYCRVQSFSMGEFVLAQGSLGKGMYIILKGKAVITVKILGREVIELAALDIGDFVGEVSLIERGPSPASVVANTALECLLITTSYFDTLSLFYPEIKYKISKAIIEGVCEHIIDLRSKVTSLMKESHMIEKSLFGEMINSLTRPEVISYESAHLEKKQFRHLLFFDGLSEEEFNEILERAELVRAPSNCTLIRENDKETSYFLIIRGAVQTSFSEHGRVAKIAVLGPQSIFGGISHISNTPSAVTYMTCERAIMLKINLMSLAHLQKNNILLWYKIFERICQSTVELERSADKLLMRLNVELYNR